MGYFELTAIEDNIIVPVNAGDYFVVDGQTVVSGSFVLTKPPVNNSELVYINGLYQNSTSYSVSNSVLTFIAGFPLTVGDEVLVRYATQG